jgi:tetratricopeptide (TPR) repeat protein
MRSREVSGRGRSHAGILCSRSALLISKKTNTARLHITCNVPGTCWRQDTWSRWRWHIPLLRARGALALSEGRFDEAWKYANESLEMATRTDSRKHVVRARQLRGEVLAADGKLEDAAGVLDSSVALSLRLKAAPDLCRACLALGKVLNKLGRENEAVARLTMAAGTVEAIAHNLTMPSLRRSFLSARPVLELYNLLHRSPPQFS